MTAPPELLEIVPEYRSRNPVVRWLFHERLSAAIRLGRLEGALSLADVGCGEGLFAGRLKQASPASAVTAFDQNEHVEALRIPGVEVRRADLTRPGALPAAAFDRIFCLDVLEHIRELAGPLAALRSALKPGGLLVVSAPSENVFHKSCRFLIKGTFSEEAGPASSPHYHRASTLAKDIAAAGFEPLERVSLPLPGPLALAILSSHRAAR